MTARAILWSALTMGLMLAACSDNAQTDADAGGGEVVLRRGNSAEPRSLDPHHVQGDWESNLVGDMLMGLTVDGPDGVSIPGAAERWEVSDDGLIWTFYLRAHNWSDGTPVTADDFVYAWRRIADPETAAEYASLLYGFKNLRAINAGEMPKETLGVRAIDAYTLELELEAPAPYLAELLSNFTAYPLPRHVVEVHRDGWTQAGIYVGNGPFTLAEWIPNDHITLVKNEGFYDAQNVAIDRVIYYPISDREAALRRFRAGELDTQDQLPPQQIDWLRENMPEVLRIAPFLGVEYFTVNHARAPFGDVRVREALNLALNREAITEQIVRLGNPPAYGVVPPGIANYPGGNAFSFAGMPHAERIERAQMLMREAGYGPDNPLVTTLTVRSTAPDARRVPAAVQQMWREIYVDLEIAQSDAITAYGRIQQGDYDIALSVWIADFNDPRNFLFLLMSDNTGLNYARYANPEFDALIARSDVEMNLERRGALLAEAEAVALNDYAWLPLYFRVTSDLVHPHVKGWVTNVEDVNRTRWLSIER